VVTCFHCYNKGHYANNCPYKQLQKQQASSQQMIPQNMDTQQLTKHKLDSIISTAAHGPGAGMAEAAPTFS